MNLSSNLDLKRIIKNIFENKVKSNIEFVGSDFDELEKEEVAILSNIFSNLNYQVKDKIFSIQKD
ncbi:MAG: hypothetical protein ACPL3E_02575, partial [Minisyncoccia bacterium]